MTMIWDSEGLVLLRVKLKNGLRRLLMRCWQVFDKPFFSPGLLSPVTYARFFRYRSQGVSLKHTNAYHQLNRYQSLHENLGIGLILRSGSLLGCIRSGFFAGRPKDFDFWVIASTESEKLEYICKVNETAKQFGLKAGPHYLSDGRTQSMLGNDIAIVRIHHQLFRRSLFCDVLFLVFNGGFWREYGIGDRRGHQPRLPHDVRYIAKQVGELDFLVPENFSDLLREEYGDGWQTPLSEH